MGPYLCVIEGAYVGLVMQMIMQKEHLEQNVTALQNFPWVKINTWRSLQLLRYTGPQCPGPRMLLLQKGKIYKNSQVNSSISGENNDLE